jgi:antitoxin PrlF
MATATITSKGQVTLPREVRTSLGLSAGDRLDFIRLEDGNYAIVPAMHSIRALKGLLPKRKRAVSLRRMEAAIRAGARGE